MGESPRPRPGARAGAAMSESTMSKRTMRRMRTMRTRSVLAGAPALLALVALLPLIAAVPALAAPAAAPAPAPAPSPAPAPAPAPGISGDYLEARTADVYTGPCFANSEMDLAGKQAVVAWHVREGAWQGVPLGGLSVVAAVRSSATLGDPVGGPR